MTDTNMRSKFEAWAKTVDYRDFSIDELAFKCFQAGAASVQGQEPVARITGYHAGFCVIQPTNPVILPTGTKLYADPVPQGLSLRSGEQCPSGWREFIENIATPRSEPLNSVCSYRDNESRRAMMGKLRETAQKLLDVSQPKEPT